MDTDWEQRARAEVRRLRREFQSHLAAVRATVEANGHSAEDFLRTTALFDGPQPPPLRPEACPESVRIFSSREHLLRSIEIPEQSIVCEIGVWKGAFTRRILAHFQPATCHLYDLRFDQLDPAVRSHASVILHEGDSGTAIASLVDESVAFAYVDGDHSYAGCRRDLFGILPKIVAGGYIQMNDYAPWSVLSGFPYGVMANAHELLNQGDVTLVGIAIQPLGYHDLLLRKRDRHGASAGATAGA